ncbi:hypothetical protein JHK86_050881 [Glycine max]|nr:hypothetical protein JHK86_050881 [Glycine max]
MMIKIDFMIFQMLESFIFFSKFSYDGDKEKKESKTISSITSLYKWGHNL